jgi:hypothetical protein
MLLERLERNLRVVVNSRAKGNQGEREVCKILSRYFGGKFERRSMGYEGNDIITPDGFPYGIEVKFDKSVRLKHFWKPTQKLKDFWKQTLAQCKNSGKHPLLCAKVEGMWFCWTHAEFGFALNAYLLEDWCIKLTNPYPDSH